MRGHVRECNTRAVALRILEMGGHPVRVHRHSKKPLAAHWPELTYTEADVIEHFKLCENVGIKLGAQGGWIVDVDIDSVKALPIALDVLPPTFRYGRESKRSSHYLYRVTRPLMFGKLDREVDKVAGDGDKKAHIELRSTGHQSLFPGSVHESGELYEVEADIPIAEIEPHELLHAFDEVARRAGWIPESKEARQPVTRTVTPSVTSTRYGKTPAREELSRLANTPDGERNDTLNDVTFRLAQLVDLQLLPESIMDDVRNVALSIGLGDTEVTKTMKSARKSAARKPRATPTERIEVKAKPAPRSFVDELIEELQLGQGRERAGIPVPGFPHLTDATFGLRGYVLFTGPSGAGKTTLVNSIALNVAQGGDGFQPLPVVYITAEMGRADVALSMLSATCRVPVRTLLVGEKDAQPIDGPTGRLNMTEPTYQRVALAVTQTLRRLESAKTLSIVNAADWMRKWEPDEHALIGLEENVRALHGPRPVLVIIDTLATLEVQPTTGRQYESDLDMDGDIVNGLKRFREALPSGSAILAVHEEGKALTGKGDGHSVRGSSKYLYSADQRWTMVYADQPNGTRKKKKRASEPSNDVTEVDLHIVKARRGGTANVVIALDHEHRHGAIREVGRWTLKDIIGKDKTTDDPTEDASEEPTTDAGPKYKSRRSKKGKR